MGGRGEEILQILLQGSSALQRYILVFSWNLCIFPRFLPAGLITKVCFALWADGSALIWHVMWQVQKICQKICAMKVTEDGTQEWMEEVIFS